MPLNAPVEIIIIVREENPNQEKVRLHANSDASLVAIDPIIA